MQSENAQGAPVESILAAFGGAREMLSADLRLLRAELAGKAQSLGSALAIAAAGGCLLFAAGLCLIAALVQGLVAVGLEPYLACLVAAALAGAAGAVAMRAGLARMKRWSAAPLRTFGQLAQVFQAGEAA